jgi:flagellar L-ring protein precursor FlgH
MNGTRVLVVAALCCASGCGPRHIQPFSPRERNYVAGRYAQVDPSKRPSEGSLFSDGVGGLLEDTRAVRVGDVVVIRLHEDADASGESSTDLQRKNKMNLGVDAVLGLVPAITAAHPNIDPKQLLSFLSESDFNGQGDTKRRGQLSGSIAVRVARDMPNGDLYVEGTKVMQINNEEYHLYVSGLVRPADIGPDNTVSSNRVADAQIEFTGRGDLADQQRKGWLSRGIDEVSPF